MQPEQLAERFRQQTAAFAATVDGVDPDTRVPTCPEWRLRDLVGHIGQAPRWMAGIIRTGEPAAPPNPLDADPGDPRGWSGWLCEGAEELLRAIQGVGAETKVWTIIGQQPAVFWLRRMLHEVSVHHADAALTSGAAFEIPTDVAAEAITEALELVSTPGIAKFQSASDELLGRTLQLQPEERSATGWRITHTEEGFTWDRTTADADTTVAGTAQNLLLLFSRRLSADDSRVTITGNHAVLDHWLSYSG